MFGLLLRRHRAWVLGGVITGSYVVGHLLGGLLADPIETVFILVNAGALMGVVVAVSLALRGQEQRQAEVESQRSEVVNLNERLERSVAELRAVTEITELIHSTLEVESVGPVLLEILEKVINIPAGSLYVIDKAKQETIFSTSSIAAAASRSYSGLELAGALPVGSPDGALSCIELVDHNQTVVVFCADSAAIDGLSSDDRIVLQAVASELVVAVENSRLYRLTKRLAITDELTDLTTTASCSSASTTRSGVPTATARRLSLLMLDVDDFKRDQRHLRPSRGRRGALAEVGSVLKSTVREVDIVARYGGEEFTIILPETDASGRVHRGREDPRGHRDAPLPRCRRRSLCPPHGEHRAGELPGARGRQGVAAALGRRRASTTPRRPARTACARLGCACGRMPGCRPARGGRRMTTVAIPRARRDVQRGGGCSRSGCPTWSRCHA